MTWRRLANCKGEVTQMDSDRRVAAMHRMRRSILNFLISTYNMCFTLQKFYKIS